MPPPDTEGSASSLEDRRFRAALGGSAITIFGQDRELRYTWIINPALDYTSPQVVGRTDHDLFAPDEATALEAMKQRVLDTGEPARGEFRVQRPGGERWFDLAVAPVRDAAGRVTGITGAVVDLTAHRALELERDRALAESERSVAATEHALAQLRAIQRISDQTLARLDLGAMLHELLRRLRMLLSADAATVLLLDEDETQLSVVASEGLGEEPMRRVHVPLGRGIAGRVAATGEPVIVDDLSTVEVVSSPLRQEIASLVAVPLRMGDRITGVVHVGTREAHRFTAEDVRLLELVAERVASGIERARLLENERRARADAEVARMEAEAANRAKSEFLATMSHELRTPLNAILGYAQLLELGIPGAVTDAQRQMLERLRGSGDHLLALVNDVLDLSKVDAGEMTMQSESGTAGETIGAALSLVAPQAEQRGVRVVTPPAAAPVAYAGDRQRVRQILTNLLSNAVKFTEPGGAITIETGEVTSAPAGARLTGPGPWSFITVRDTGPGIATEKQAAVFEPFVQVEGGYTRTHGGTGLGLAISRRLARLMSGDITLESVPGQGATFTIWLPTPAAQQGTETLARTGEHAAALPQTLRGVEPIGRELRERAPEILDRFVSRLRGDPAFGIARSLREPLLMDHQLLCITCFGQTLVLLEESNAPSALVLRETTEIERTVATLHGQQRQRLGWTEALLQREYDLLGEELGDFLRRVARRHPGAAIEAATVIVEELVLRVARTSLRAFRQASSLAGA